MPKGPIRVLTRRGKAPEQGPDRRPGRLDPARADEQADAVGDAGRAGAEEHHAGDRRTTTPATVTCVTTAPQANRASIVSTSAGQNAVAPSR